MKREMSLIELLERMKELADIEKAIIDEKVINEKASGLDVIRKDLATQKIEMEQWNIQDPQALRSHLEHYKVTLNNAVESLVNIYSVLLALERIEKLKKKYVALVRKHFKQIEKDIKSDNARVVKKLKKTLGRTGLRKRELLDVLKEIHTMLNYNKLWKYHLKVIKTKLNNQLDATIRRVVKE